jgi:hypothetical protein
LRHDVEKLDIDEGLDWWEDPDWWDSKGAKGVGMDRAKAAGRTKKYDISGSLKKMWSGAAAVTGVSSGNIGATPGGIQGGGGAGGSSVGTNGGNGAGVGVGGPGTVIVNGQGFVDMPEVKVAGFDNKAKVEILEVKEMLQRAISGFHIPERSVIAGGVFVSLFNSEPIQDIDVFVLGSEDDQQITLPDIETPGMYTTKKDFQNYTGRNDIIAIFDDSQSKIQYIYTKVKTPRELLEAFDFVHCCCAYYDDKIWISPKVYDAIKNKWLIPNIEHVKPERKERFTKRGFVDPGNLMNFYGP